MVALCLYSFSKLYKILNTEKYYTMTRVIKKQITTIIFLCFFMWG